MERERERRKEGGESGTTSDELKQLQTIGSLHPPSECYEFVEGLFRYVSPLQLAQNARHAPCVAGSIGESGTTGIRMF